MEELIMEQFKFRYSYVAIYRLSIAPPSEIKDVANINGILVSLTPGLFQIQRSIPIYQHEVGFGGMMMGVEDVVFPQGAYLWFDNQLEVNGQANKIENTRLLNSEVLSILDLEFEGLIGEKVFEGPINKPGQTIFDPEGPIRIYGCPLITDADLSKAILNGFDKLSRLDDKSRQRLRLMSRWVRRAEDTLNQIDKFLFLYFSIEVYPSFDTTDVPRAIRDFLHKNIFPDLEMEEIKNKLMLGRIARFRADIVHDGKSSVSQSEETSFSKMLDILHRIATVCMYYLATGEYRGSLDKWLRS